MRDPLEALANIHAIAETALALGTPTDWPQRIEDLLSVARPFVIATPACADPACAHPELDHPPIGSCTRCLCPQFDQGVPR